MTLPKFAVGDHVYEPRSGKKGIVTHVRTDSYQILLGTDPRVDSSIVIPFSFERFWELYVPIYPDSPPAKGDVYNLDYPDNAINGYTITIKASVLNKGGTSGEFSLRLILAPNMVLVTRYVGWIAPYRFSVIESLSVTMPSSGASANLGIQCIRHT